MEKRPSIILDFDLAFKIFICLTTCSWMPGITQSGLQMLFLDYGAMVLMALSIYYPEEREFKNPMPAIIMAVCIAVALICNYRAFSINIVHVLAGCMIYCAMVRSLKDPRNLIKFLLILGFINIFIFFLQKFGFDPIYMPQDSDSVIQKQHLSSPGILGRNYHLSFFLLPLLPLGLMLKKWYSLIFLVLGSIVVIWIGSWTAIFSLGILVLFFISKWLSKTALTILLCLSCLVIGIFMGPMILHKLMLRGEIYSFIIKSALVNPFIGHGLGSFDLAAGLDTAKPIFDSAFNQALKFMYELGILATSFILIKMFLYYRKIYAGVEFALLSIVLFLTVPIFHETLRFAKFITMGIVIFGIYEILCSTQKQGEVNEW